MEIKELYRYNGRRSGEGCHNMELDLQVFTVLKRTSRGFWIHSEGRRRWVSDYHRARYAYPTKSEALDHLFHRQARYIEILRCRIKGARAVMALIETEERVAEGGQRFVIGDKVEYGFGSDGKVIGVLQSPGTGRYVYKIWNSFYKEERFIPEEELKIKMSGDGE